MRGVLLAAVVLMAALVAPGLAAATPQATAEHDPAAVDAQSPVGAAAPADLPDLEPATAAPSGPPVRAARGQSAGPAADAGGLVGPSVVHSVEGIEDAATEQAPVTVDHELYLTPDDPGALRVEVQVSRLANGSDAAENLSLGLSRRATVINATGFDREGDRFHLSDGRDDASIVYRLRVNRTAPDGGYEAVDVGKWAIVRTPTPSILTDGVTVDRRYSVDGEGVVNRGLAYMGPHRQYNRTVQGERLTLVVPEAAEMRSRPAAILDSLATASRNLNVGERDRRVMFVAAPTTVDWAHAAQQVGDSDAWVADDQSLYDPRNAWLHEYVHVRQSFRTTSETRWLVEGSATYYAALMSLRQGLVDFESFRRHLQSGTAPRNSHAVLAAPRTWEDTRAEYLKGALVVAALDRRIRRSANDRRSFQWVFERLNAHQGRVTHSTLTSLLGSVGGPRLRETGHRLATERTTPPTWGVDTHQRAYGWAPPEVSTDLAEVRVTGPGGSRTVGASPDEVVLLTDQRLVAVVTATNDGNRPASYVAPLRVNVTPVERTVGTVGANGLATATVSHRFTEPGSYHVVVGGQAIRVRVVEPARSAQVADVSVDPAPGPNDGMVTVVTRVHNRQDRPTRLSLPVTVDGEVVATRTVSLGPSEVERVETTIRLERTGRHEVAVAGEAAAVNVSESGEIVTETDTGVLDDGTVDLPPASARRGAVGLAAMLSALVAGLTLFYRRR